MSFSLDEFQKISSQFKLGNLTTESFHQLSRDLSKIVKKNISDAVNTLSQIDKDALNLLKKKSQQIYDLQITCQRVLKNKNKVFLSGCGATGRLALSIEKLFREKFNSNQVVAFMAGGDFALIKSVESFEDNLSYGQRQLKDLGFSADDLVLGITEGGETTFVIGSTLYAAENAINSPYFLYCNPDSELMNVKRSQEVIEDKRVIKLNLSVGPMAISGSTRMQATSVQMIATGFALLYNHKSYEEFQKEFYHFIDELITSSKEFVTPFIAAESDLYKRGGHITYKVSSDIAISILTDTTERSPTFSLQGFEKNDEPNILSLSYLCLENTKSSAEAWSHLLSREPRCLSWPEISLSIGKDDALKFDISENALTRRQNVGGEHGIFNIHHKKNNILFQFGEIEHSFCHDKDLFFTHMYLKLSLNMHSTLIMGLMGRFEGNMMTYVRPSNFKLIDRAARYIKELLVQKDIVVPESLIVEKIFEYQKLQITEPVVIFVRDQILDEIKAQKI